MSEIKVSRLFFYPIKSFRGLETKQLSFTKQGPHWDRKWMIVDASGRFLTQRQMPELARLGLAWFDDSHVEISVGGGLVADFGLFEKESAPLSVTVWKDEVKAFEVSKEVSESLSKVVNKDIRLVRLDDENERPGHFADQQPFLVISEASLRMLEEKSKVSLSIARFRPNIVVSGAGPHGEDDWLSFRAGETDFKKIKACTRCRITQTHPLTGVVGEEPLQTLKTYRKTEKGIAFGFYYGTDRDGEIHVGDSIYAE